ncbi:RagB/SusD family nutrient uptake outer membrane protein [uncultured Polaribacter sp.]|uniref:RagB/SusD family nutrient uptake outer membrane protein n=1 Tax=uncultured Polaribacter sp. TaxID=174711 RepID=UPI0026084940|nr:RagB/SusD family nutrient uptake outer membrane protein [uncultured Polaribacter sp.]
MKNIVIIISIFTGLMFCSCDEELNVKPENYLFEEQLITNDKSAQSSLLGVYTQLNSVYITQYTELYTGLMDGTLVTTTTGLNLQSFINSFDPSISTLKFFYRAPYTIVNSANATLKTVTGNDKVSQTMRERILGEAHFLRAFGHLQTLKYHAQFFDVTSQYGIVLKDELSTFENREKKRATVKESYDFILDDLDKCIDSSVPFTDNFYASTLAAKAFKANILLYMGGDANYTNAIDLANEVIDDGAVELEPNFEDVFANGVNNSEVIFARYTDNTQTSKSLFLYQTQQKASAWLKDFMQNDPRAIHTFTASNSKIKKVYLPSIKGGPTNFIRLAEVYLIKAECQARLNLLTEAEATLNIVRKRAYGGTPPALIYTNKEELLDLIFDEYVKELCFEAGTVWTAAIRHGKVEELKPNVTSSNQYIMPIPLLELQTNSLFGEQNPGYDGI